MCLCHGRVAVSSVRTDIHDSSQCHDASYTESGSGVTVRVTVTVSLLRGLDESAVSPMVLRAEMRGRA